MIANQILQNTLDGLKNITRVELSILDLEGKITATTEENPQSLVRETLSFIGSLAESQLIKGYHFFKILNDGQVEYVVAAKGDGEDVYQVGKIVAFQVQTLLTAYKERFDKDNFVKNLLLDNLLVVDIYNRSKKLHIITNVPRVVYLIETSVEKDVNSLEIVKSIFPAKNKDFITAVDEKSIILIKEIGSEEKNRSEEIQKIAKSIVDTLNTEALTKVHVGYGTVVNDIKDVSRSYKEARMSLDVGKIFYNTREINAYTDLGIGRLIYQLPIPLCKLFIREIFVDKSPDDFDEETLTTINKFFENSLNVSETSRQLYIHRNTLVYRLDKLQKSTGLDLREFEDAITFRIALMVVKYMKSIDSLE